MKITAAVVRERGGAFSIEQLDLTDPRADELLVEVAASGMCATDLHGRDGYFPSMPFPAVFGHEGAGVVRAVGRAVSEFKPGDRVVMSYPWCGACPNCVSHRQNYCLSVRQMKMSGRRPDGSTLHAQNGKPVYGAYFQQSSFGNFAIANAKFAVKVPDGAPIELLGPLACGGQTGAGAVLNVMKPAHGDSFGVFGVGSVGLSGLMAAKIADCDPIIAVDVHEFTAGAGARIGRDPYHQPRGPHRCGGGDPQAHRCGLALFARNLGTAGGVARGDRGADAGGAVRAARQCACRH